MLVNQKLFKFKTHNKNMKKSKIIKNPAIGGLAAAVLAIAGCGQMAENYANSPSAQHAAGNLIRYAHEYNEWQRQQNENNGTNVNVYVQNNNQQTQTDSSIFYKNGLIINKRGPTLLVKDLRTNQINSYTATYDSHNAWVNQTFTGGYESESYIDGEWIQSNNRYVGSDGSDLFQKTRAGGLSGENTKMDK